MAGDFCFSDVHATAIGHEETGQNAAQLRDAGRLLRRAILAGFEFLGGLDQRR